VLHGIYTVPQTAKGKTEMTVTNIARVRARERYEANRTNARNVETTRPDEYQGWTNRETWNVKLWIDNERPLYEATRALADCARNNNSGAWKLGEAIRVFMEAQDVVADMDASFVSDLIGYALQARVNWTEIAESIMGER
jgi:hypothetical protein